MTRRVEDRDLAHEHDMEVLRKQQLRDDCGDRPEQELVDDDYDWYDPNDAAFSREERWI